MWYRRPAELHAFILQRVAGNNSYDNCIGNYRGIQEQSQDFLHDAGMGPPIRALKRDFCCVEAEMRLTLGLVRTYPLA